MTLLRLIGAFLRRNAFIETSYRMQFVMTLCGILSSIATFYFVSHLIDQRGTLTHTTAYGGHYFAFVLVGMACAQYSSVAMYGLASQLRQEQVQGTLEAMLVHPVRPLQLALGLPAWDFCWATVNLMLYLLIGMGVFHCDLSRANWLGALLVMGASLLVFAALGLLSAAFVLVFKRGNPIQWAISTAFVLLGGVYFPVDLLPAPLGITAQGLPITHVLHGLRRALLEGAALSTLWPSLGLILLFGVALLPLGLWAMTQALRQARRRGGIGAY